MSAVAEIFKRIQLFFFAFSLAATCMMFVGMASGKIERGPVYLGVAEKIATFLMEHTSLLDGQTDSRHVAILDARHDRSDRASQSVTIDAPRNSLSALKQRQRQRIYIQQNPSTGG